MVLLRSLRKPGVAHSVRVSGKTYQFVGGQDAPVPESVAAVLLTKKMDRGGELFRRVDPEIVGTEGAIQSALGVQFEWKTKW